MDQSERGGNRPGTVDLAAKMQRFPGLDKPRRQRVLEAGAALDKSACFV